MAVVYLAEDPQVGRLVAIKALSRRASIDPLSSRRFKREAAAIAALEHSAIVPLYDHGEQDGVPYLVFRYMEGGSLEDVVARRGAMQLDNATEIAKRVGDALDYAHRNGVIHRDVKPANILFDRNGDAWLGDFGIAVFADDASSLTLGAIGTPKYMSPEQARGEKATALSDIYSLGATLFEAVTGRPPFESDVPLALLHKHVNQQVPNACDLAPGLPLGAGQALQRAMAKDPAGRWESGHSFINALLSAAASTPRPRERAASGSSRRASRAAGAGSTPRRSARVRPWLFGGILAGLLVTLLVGAVLALSWLSGDGTGTHRTDTAGKDQPTSSPEMVTI
jgi:serine/threonine-protein kinase